MRTGKSMCQEITIAKISLQNMVDFCIREKEEFRIKWSEEKYEEIH